jgi:(p)ppGpp synthase/HD superfamily hydrolase
MKQASMLGIAIAVAAKSHEGQFDKGGSPYILHPLTVMHKLGSEDPELNQIAILHDVVEDTEVTLNDLVNLGFSDRVVTAIDALTKRSGESYAAYLARVASCKDATLVKLPDLQHNSDLRRLKGVSDKDIARHKKYMRAYDFLYDIAHTRVQKKYTAVDLCAYHFGG